MKAIFSNTHLKRVNIFVLESMIPRLDHSPFYHSYLDMYRLRFGLRLINDCDI